MICKNRPKARHKTQGSKMLSTCPICAAVQLQCISTSTSTLYHYYCTMLHQHCTSIWVLPLQVQQSQVFQVGGTISMVTGPLGNIWTFVYSGFWNLSTVLTKPVDSYQLTFYLDCTLYFLCSTRPVLACHGSRVFSRINASFSPDPCQQKISLIELWSGNSCGLKTV